MLALEPETPGRKFSGSDEDKHAFEGEASEEQSQKQKQSQLLLARPGYQGRVLLTIHWKEQDVALA